ncbi:hypothetical protein AUJ94_02720 [bacterium CG2_30_40_12]|uniref:PilN domain-containing protein n=1 Tax=candidate division WWE3 bacterium CG23_combo_of_CG06-09_8_20_14_all_40_14 TaxID=1975095 RepID=A0A2G9XDS1_UNCKA|nr:MAG: hypothetical protein AUJ94_02720 [bacterium CG2_30_40_12]PIP04643.1 MAG: hypothetical protein COX53_01370 [candidate division WWE3 bacterium CG23_combo_of_CG06-09_8_20_14_all_40_14]PJE50882.1 MAG: hypothetical protein COV27_02220 [candidate division WWE3 bacterium CG10_big_fil_rev_8_21_14_0_10_39_14]
MQDINLIPEELKKQKKLELQLKGLFKTSLGFLILSILTSAGLLVYKTSLDKSLSDLIVKIDTEEQKISALESMESKMYVLGEKLVFAQKILNSRLNYSSLLREFGGVLPSGVYLTDVAIASSDKTTIGGITSSYAMLSELVKNISNSSLMGNSIFEYSEVTSVNLKEEVSRIEFSMNVYLKKDALKDGIKGK